MAARFPTKTRPVTNGTVAAESGMPVSATITAAITAMARRYHVFRESE